MPVDGFRGKCTFLQSFFLGFDGVIQSGPCHFLRISTVPFLKHVKKTDAYSCSGNIMLYCAPELAQRHVPNKPNCHDFVIHGSIRGKTLSDPARDIRTSPLEASDEFALAGEEPFGDRRTSPCGICEEASRQSKGNVRFHACSMSMSYFDTLHQQICVP